MGGMKLNEETTVPFFWLVSALIFSCGGAWVTAGAWFSVTYDIREMKGDIKLLKANAGIYETQTPAQEKASRAALIQDAAASEVRRHAHGK